MPFRDMAVAQGILPKANSKQAIGCDSRVYKDRSRGERLFNKLKQFRRIATRYALNVARIYPVDCFAMTLAQSANSFPLHFLGPFSRGSAEWKTGLNVQSRHLVDRVAALKGQQHLPGEEAWLVGEWRSNGERKYYLSNLPADTALKRLAGAIKARWVCEQAHQQMKEELGPDHFEGRSWKGLHRHGLMTMIAYPRALRASPSKRGPLPKWCFD